MQIRLSGTSAALAVCQGCAAVAFPWFPLFLLRQFVYHVGQETAFYVSPFLMPSDLGRPVHYPCHGLRREKGVTRTMFWNKTKLVGPTMLATAVIASVGMHAARGSAAPSDDQPKWLGLTLISEIAPGNGKTPKSHRVLEVGRDGKPRWEIDDVTGPIDARMISDNKVLIAEYDGERVTERDTSGAIIWQVANLRGGPTNVQRLANGNTFIAVLGRPPGYVGPLIANQLQVKKTPGRLLEVDRKGEIVAEHVIAEGVRAGYQLPNGQFVCLTLQGTCLWLDAKGKEIKRFAVESDGKTGAIDVMPDGHLLVVGKSGVKEYDGDGKVTWQFEGSPIYSAMRLPNGHTLLGKGQGGVNPSIVIEVDSDGTVIWEFASSPGSVAVHVRQR
jgi:hypothetical protein